MINEVRNTVLDVLSKDNRGYMTPDEFNQFSRQVQLEIFQDHAFEYSYHLNKKNARMHNSELSDIPDRIKQIMDRFLVDDVIDYNGTTLKFYVPGDNPASPNDPKPFQIIDLIYNGSAEIDRVTNAQAIKLINSKLTYPTLKYPKYVLDEQGIKVYPTSIVNNVMMNYIRYPRDPKWTYSTLSGGEPVYNASLSDHQDFELPKSDFPALVLGVLELAGVSIREGDLVQYVNAENAEYLQKKQ